MVQSLAKWKRKALKDYDFRVGKGLYCDMNAIRRDEDLDNLHSIYVDQWDWEKVIRLEDRNEAYLKSVVRSIVSAVCATEMNLHAMFPQLQELPLHSPNVTFITTQELEDKYPDLTPKERENAFVKENGTTFLMKIGAPLKSGKPHDGRAPDYDDWDLNGDLLFWNDPLQCSYELSSMGIRVSPESMDKQLTMAGCDDRRALPFHKAVLNGELPYSIGGGIGQSRLCMLLLGSAQHRRSAGQRLGRRHPRSLRKGWHPAAVIPLKIRTKGLVSSTERAAAPGYAAVLYLFRSSCDQMAFFLRPFWRRAFPPGSDALR